MADDLALGDGGAACDGDRAELEHRDGVAVCGLDRQRAAACGDRAGERDDAGGRRANLVAGRGADVDAAVLAGLVLVARERERTQDRPIRRPDPAGRNRDDDQGRDRSDDRDEEHAPHRIPPS
ncbi:MAG TPA: hypothetical protein VEW11_06975 [Gaiellaceae bacterium]|nr:hypothetical protein [Gaiellaceae bacterium]